MEHLADQYSLDVWENYEAFMTEMACRAEHAPYDDTVMQKFSQAYLQFWARPEAEAYRQLSLDFIARQEIHLPSHNNNLFFKAHQAILLQDAYRYRLGYPQNFHDLRAWGEFLERFTDPQHPDFIKLRYIVLNEQLQANKAARGKSVAFVASGMKQQFEEPTIIHEVGSGDGQIMKAIVQRMLSRTVVMEPDGSHEADPLITNMFNLIVQNATVDEAYGIEASPPVTPDALLWVKSSSLNPSSELDREQLFGHHEDTFDLLSMMQPANVHTIKGDYLRLSKRARQRLERKKATVTFFSHSLYQNPGRFDEMIKTALHNTDPRGKIVVQDFMVVHPDRPQELIFIPHWYESPYSCQVAVLDADKPEDGFYSVLEWETARNQRVRFARDIGRLTEQFTGARRRP